MNTIRDIIQINEQELLRGIAGTAASWHAKYNQSAWVYVGNLDHSLTEGDIICVLSQYGEIDDVHLVRDEVTGNSRGFAFCKYSDARSCVLAVDNFCGVQLCGRSLRVDHVENYRLPKHLLEKEDQLEAIFTKKSATGHAYQGQELANDFNLEHGQDLFAPPSSSKELSSTIAIAVSTKKEPYDNDDSSVQRKERKRRRKEAKHRKQSHKDDRKRDHHRGSRDRDDDDVNSTRKKKRKHHDR